MSSVVPLGTAQRWPRTGQSIGGRFLWYILIIGEKGEGGKREDEARWAEGEVWVTLRITRLRRTQRGASRVHAIVERQRLARQCLASSEM